MGLLATDKDSFIAVCRMLVFFRFLQSADQLVLVAGIIVLMFFDPAPGVFSIVIAGMTSE